MKHAEEFENFPWEKSESGKKLAEAIIQQFNDAWLPRILHWAGRQFVLTLQTQRTREVMQMDKPNLIMAVMIRKVVWFVFTMKERLLPHSKISTQERARAKKVLPPTHKEPNMAKISQCPFHPNVTKKFLARSVSWWK